jgi:signal transduction histidine kinase
LDAAHIEGGEFAIAPAPADLAGLVAEAVELAAPLAVAKGLRLDRELPEGACLVACDRERVLQALSSLLSNAVKFTPAGGAITARLVAEPGWARVEIRDTGVGIPGELLPHLFERYRPSPPRGGTGLGLYVAHGIALAHGGSLDVASEEGRGSVFTLRLPRHPEGRDAP